MELLARGLAVGDTEDAFNDETGRLLLSKTAESEIGKRLWSDYQEFASRNHSEYEIIYLFVDGSSVRPGAASSACAVTGPAALASQCASAQSRHSWWTGRPGIVQNFNAPCGTQLDGETLYMFREAKIESWRRHYNAVPLAASHRHRKRSCVRSPPLTSSPLLS